MRLPCWVVNILVRPFVVGTLALMYHTRPLLGLMAISMIFGFVVAQPYKMERQEAGGRR